MPTIFEPKTVSSLLSIITRHPESIIFSDGIQTVLQSNTRNLSLPENLVYIGKVEELQKMKRSERYLEIGTAVRINQIIDKGKNIIPVILLDAMKQITPPNFKNLLTIGGMICSKSSRNNIYAVLCILDAKLEIRSLVSSRWISTSQLFNGDNIDLAPGEIVTKIRIYLGDFDINIYRKIDNDFCQKSGIITFSAIATVQKGNINFLKFIYSTSDLFIIRDKGIEAELTGQNIPLSDKSIQLSVSHFSEQLAKKYMSIPAHKCNIIRNTFEWFLKELNYY